jgi:hypothetical protein
MKANEKGKELLHAIIFVKPKTGALTLSGVL